jgi:hypothetical protein
VLKVYKDESIHSVIYRTHILNGVSDYSNIITAKGGWASFPLILKNTLHLYEPIDDFMFLHLLRDIGLAKITSRTFENPMEYRYDLDRFFGQNQRSRKVKRRTLPINYCLKCIKKDIKKFGHGFIKVTWKNNSYCFIHKTYLNTAIVKNRKEAVDALSFILRGTHPNKYGTPSYRSKYFHDHKDYHKKTCDYIAPCLKDEFKKFISSNWKSFPKELLGKNYSSDKYLKEPYMMEGIYSASKMYKYAKFDTFWKENATSKTLYGGVINRKKIEQKIFKYSKSDCQRCSYYNCAANLVIIAPFTLPKLLYGCIESICNIRHNAYALRLISDPNNYICVKDFSIEKKKALHAMGEHWKTVLR